MGEIKVIVVATQPAEPLGYKGPLALVRLCGVPLVIRCLYTLKSVGLREVLLITGPYGPVLKGLLGDGSGLGISISYAEDLRGALSWLGGLEALLVPVGAVASESFFKLLMDQGGELVAHDGDERLDVVRLSRRSLEEALGKGLRELGEIASFLLEEGRAKALDISGVVVQELHLKRDLRPMCVIVRDRASWLRAKRSLVFRTQKGLHFTSYINKPVEDRLVYHISERKGITPNAITVLGNLLAFSIIPLFITGYFLHASLLAYLVGIIDGLDGKLARSRGFLTKLGHIEHSFDMLFEQSWYLSFITGLYLALGSWWLPILGGAFLVLDGFVRHVYMQFKDAMGVALTAYSGLDRAFARVDGRRNVYLIYMIVCSALGFPLYALFAMAIHAFITATFYVLRGLKHMREADRASGVLAWMELARRAPELPKLKAR